MESICNDLSCVDPASRLSAVQRLEDKLRENIDEGSDMKSRIVDGVLSCLRDRDSDFSTVRTTFDCLQLLVGPRYEEFEQYSNIIFDSLMEAFAETKTTTRQRASDVMMSLINSLGITSAFEKLSVYFKSQSPLVKEQILTIISRLQEQYGDDIMFIPDLVGKVATLLSDPSTTVLRRTVEVLAKMHVVFGEGLFLELQAANISASQISVVNEAIINPAPYGAAQTQAPQASSLSSTKDNAPAQPHNITSSSMSSSGAIARGLGFHGSTTSTNNVTEASSSSAPAGLARRLGTSSVARRASLSSGGVGVNLLAVAGETTATAASNGVANSTGRVTATDRDRVTATDRGDRDRGVRSSSSMHARSPTVTVGTSSAAAYTGGDNVMLLDRQHPQQQQEKKLTANSPTTVTSTASSGGSTVAGGGGGGVFSAGFIVSLITEGAPPRPVRLYSEKDMTKAMEGVVTGLRNTEDWQARINALVVLQGIARGDGVEFDSFLKELKMCHELLAAQVADLRSIVSKEACKTVAILSRRLGVAFFPIAELLLPTLLKLIILKIQVIASSADKCIRVLVTSSSMGYPKLINPLLESCASRTPAQRKSSLEYVSLAAAIWRTDSLERHLTSLKQVVRTCVTDADATARRAARQLFWVLRSRPQWQSTMDVFLSDLDASTQKHVHAEMQHPTAEFQELMSLLNKPFAFNEGDLIFSGTSAAVATDSSVSSSDSDLAPPPPLSSFESAAGTKTSSSSLRAPSPSPASSSSSSFAATTGRSTSTNRLSVRTSAFHASSSAGSKDGGGPLGSNTSTSESPSTSAAADAGFPVLPVPPKGGGGLLRTAAARSSGTATVSMVTSSVYVDDGGDEDDAFDVTGLPLSSTTGTTSNSAGIAGGAAASRRLGGGPSRRMSLALAPPQRIINSSSNNQSSAAAQAQGSTSSNNMDHDTNYMTPAMRRSSMAFTMGSSSSSSSSGGGSLLQQSSSSEAATATTSVSVARSRLLSGPAREVVGDDKSTASSARSAAGGIARSGGLGLVEGPKRIMRPVQTRSDPATAAAAAGGGEQTTTVVSQQGGAGGGGMADADGNLQSTGIAGGATTGAGGSGAGSVSVSNSRGGALPPRTRAAISNNNNNSSGSSGSATGLLPPPPPPPLPSSGTGTEGSGGKTNTERGGEKVPVGASSSSATAVATGTLSLDSLRKMAEDSHWETRLRSFETMVAKLTTATAGTEAKDNKDTATAISVISIESFVDSAVAHLGDAHQKVATEALAVLTVCVVQFSSASSSKLGVVLVALFQRLADRRAQIRDQANNLLNITRTNYDPNSILVAMSPRILEIPERMKTALLQYLGAIVPHCLGFFSQPHNTWAFLGRMANILGCGGSKPSATLTVAGRRLLVLVYNVSPQVVLGQIATLPLQQQQLIKKLLESTVADIDGLVIAAGRADWNNNRSAAATASASAVAAGDRPRTGSSSSNAPSVQTAQTAPASSSSSMVASPTMSVHTREQQRGEEGVTSSPSKHDDLSSSMHATNSSSFNSPLKHSSSSPIISSSSSSSAFKLSHSHSTTTSPTANSSLIHDHNAEMVAVTPTNHQTSRPSTLTYDFPPASSSPSASGSGSHTTTNTARPSSPYIPIISDDGMGYHGYGYPGYHESKSSMSTPASTSPLGLPSVSSVSPAAVASIVPFASSSSSSSYLSPSASPTGAAGAGIAATSPTSSSSSFRSPLSVSNQTTATTATATATTAAVDAVPRTPISSGSPGSIGMMIKRSTNSNSSSKNSSSPVSDVNYNTTASAATTYSHYASKDNKENTEAAADGGNGGCIKDVLWLLSALTPASNQQDKVAAVREIRNLARTANEEFWQKNTAQIVSVLLESFNPDSWGLREVYSRRVDTVHPGLKSPCSSALSGKPLTGYSPMNNGLPAEQQSDLSNHSSSSYHTMKDVKTGSCSSSSPNAGHGNSETAALVKHADAMHLACKALLLVVRHRGKHVKIVLDLLVSKLCQAAAFAPVAVSLHCEQILIELAPLDPHHFIRVATPFASVPKPATLLSSVPGSEHDAVTSPHVRLLALHVLSVAIRGLQSSMLLAELPHLVHVILPSLSSSLVDIRKAVVFVLVEAYLLIGDALFPFVAELSPAQKKLLTIYIEKQMQSASGSRPVGVAVGSSPTVR